MVTKPEVVWKKIKQKGGHQNLYKGTYISVKKKGRKGRPSLKIEGSGGPVSQEGVVPLVPRASRGVGNKGLREEEG